MANKDGLVNIAFGPMKEIGTTKADNAAFHIDSNKPVVWSAADEENTKPVSVNVEYGKKTYQWIAYDTEEDTLARIFGGIPSEEELAAMPPRDVFRCERIEGFTYYFQNHYCQLEIEYESKQDYVVGNEYKFKLE